MSKEHPKLETGSLRGDYVTTQSEIEEINDQISVLQKHYNEEISTHQEVDQLLNSGEINPFAEEYKMLIGSRDAELTPLHKKERELTARLRRIYVIAWNEANKKEKMDTQYKLHQEVLASVKEMHGEIRHAHDEFIESSKIMEQFTDEADELAVSLEKLLSKEFPTRDDEEKICDLYMVLIEVRAKIAQKKHFVDSSPLKK